MTKAQLYPNTVDIFILGAGPAGLCAALRLLDMGYSVGLLEQAHFPRPQIGESLSPGISNIFSYLNADSILANSIHIKNTSANILWENKSADQVYFKQNNGGVIVNRSDLDQSLLNLAIERGLNLLQPAKLKTATYEQPLWTLHIDSEQEQYTVTCKVVLDARGRKGTLLKDRITTAPTSLATWTHIDADKSPTHALMEAIPEGWIWGSPVSGDKYRVMAFTDAETVTANKSSLLNVLTSNSELFAFASQALNSKSIETCLVNSFVHQSPWNNSFIKLGEAAFTLDPLSSTGVEKAMRFSLQVAIAINTYLLDEDDTIAKDFYEEKLIGSVVNHCQWTADYYRSSWAIEHPYWKKRANFQFELPLTANAFIKRLHSSFYQNKTNLAPSEKPSIPVDLVINQLWHQSIHLSPLIEYVDSYAIDNNRINRTQVVKHPNLKEPIAYLEQINLKSLLNLLLGKTIAQSIDYLYQYMPKEKAKKILVYLWQHQLIEVS